MNNKKQKMIPGFTEAGHVEKYGGVVTRAGYIVLWGADGSANCLIDVITSDPTMPNVCPRGAIQTGAAAEVAALSKERAWTAQAEAQGRTFYPLAIEAGGPLNARFHEFLQLLAVASSPSPAESQNEQLSWRLRCSASVRSASRELAQSFLPAPFLGLPLGVSTDVGPCP